MDETFSGHSRTIVSVCCVCCVPRVDLLANIGDICNSPTSTHHPKCVRTTAPKQKWTGNRLYSSVCGAVVWVCSILVLCSSRRFTWTMGAKTPVHRAFVECQNAIISLLLLVINSMTEQAAEKSGANKMNGRAQRKYTFAWASSHREYCTCINPTNTKKALRWVSVKWCEQIICNWLRRTKESLGNTLIMANGKNGNVFACASRIGIVSWMLFFIHRWRVSFVRCASVYKGKNRQTYVDISCAKWWFRALRIIEILTRAHTHERQILIIK